MITGISPPPMVITSVMPKISEATVVMMTPASPNPPSGEMQRKRIPIAAITRMPALMKFLPGIVMFFLNILSPASLPQAMSEPVNATAPMRIVRPSVSAVKASSVTPAVYWEMATSIEERPPKPLKRATSWGIPVISTFLAQMKPTTLPPAIARTMRRYESHPPSITSCEMRTETTAISIPTEE